LIISADAILKEFCKERFPKLAITLQITLSHDEYLPSETKVIVISASGEQQELKQLLITDTDLTNLVTAHLTKRNNMNSSSPPDEDVQHVYELFENMIIGRITRDYDYKKSIAKLDIGLITEFGFQSLGEVVESCKMFKRIRRWYFILNLQLVDGGELGIPFDVVFEYCAYKKEEKLMVNVTTMKTIAHKFACKQKVFEIIEEEKECGFHELLQRVRTWIRTVVTNNKALSDVIGCLYEPD